jgi:hypothetical protein
MLQPDQAQVHPLADKRIRHLVETGLLTPKQIVVAIKVLQEKGADLTMVSNLFPKVIEATVCHDETELPIAGPMEEL